MTRMCWAGLRGDLLQSVLFSSVSQDGESGAAASSYMFLCKGF